MSGGFSRDVSAIIPVLGPQPLLARAVASALAQAHVREVIVVDDGSPEPVELASDGRLKILRLQQNKGPGAARNAGARLASGAWLAFLDADDVWLPGKTARQLDALSADATGAQGAVCAFAFHRGSRRVTARPPAERLGFDEALSGAHFGLGSAMLVSHTAFLRSGGYDESFLRHEDWDWLLRFARTAHFVTVSEALTEISHGYRAPAGAAGGALDRLEEMTLASALTPVQRRTFRAALALERASLALTQRQRRAAVLQLLRSAANRPVWTIQALLTRVISGSIPGA
jgi:glycosyltransferase involved in cell wall biosynthesis